MEIFHTIPDIDGLYWYIVPGQKPEPVLVDVERYGSGKFAGFNGRKQSWLRDNEYLVGPQLAPEIKQ
ncbi:MAG: hypothetical protein CML22_06740 [Rheinheimera sp.]|nr:hypothetical protein [Rheinheimera sp.]MBM33979.1 hypothetical protein [Rheinheimera sp.]|tara:strand:- start:867 stop:1067 length:201 start_codon:yes stop_codon:yes gene_type:complete